MREGMSASQHPRTHGRHRVHRPEDRELLLTQPLHWLGPSMKRFQLQQFLCWRGTMPTHQACRGTDAPSVWAELLEVQWLVFPVQPLDPVMAGLTCSWPLPAGAVSWEEMGQSPPSCRTGSEASWTPRAAVITGHSHERGTLGSA